MSSFPIKSFATGSKQHNSSDDICPVFKLQLHPAATIGFVIGCGCVGVIDVVAIYLFLIFLIFNFFLLLLLSLIYN